MLRARLASVILAGGLLLTSTGCGNMNLFERFHCGRQSSQQALSPECACQSYGGVQGAIPTGYEGAGGPILTGPEGPTFAAPPGAPPQIQPQFQQQFQPQGPPTGPAPRIVPVPATPTPWTGQ